MAQPNAYSRPCGLEGQVAGSVWRWAKWIIVAAGLDLAAWSGLRHVPALAGNPVSASALVLCWVHAFVLPSLFGRPWRGLSRLVLAAGLGIVAAPFAVAAGVLAGLQVGSMALLTVLAFSGPSNGSAVYDPPGPLLRVVEDTIEDIVFWSGPAAGTAVAAVVAVGLAGLLPDAQRPRVSWWVVMARAWASVVFMPDWSVALQPAWREPVLLIAAGLPSVLLVNWHAMAPTPAQ